MEEASEQIYDIETKSLDFRNVRATDFTNNKRVILPELDNDPEEIRRNNLKNELRQVVEKYKNENCDKSGNIVENNLSDKTLKDVKNLKRFGKWLLGVLMIYC